MQGQLWLTSYTTIEMKGELIPVELDTLILFIDTATRQLLIAMRFMAAPRLE